MKKADNNITRRFLQWSLGKYHEEDELDENDEMAIETFKACVVEESNPEKDKVERTLFQKVKDFLIN